MDTKRFRGVELNDEEMNQVSGGVTITDDAADLIAEREVGAERLAATKAPVFKAGKTHKDAVK